MADPGFLGPEVCTIWGRGSGEKVFFKKKSTIKLSLQSSI